MLTIKKGKNMVLGKRLRTVLDRSVCEQHLRLVTHSDG